MPAYALAHLAEAAPTPEVLEYIERIQETLDPFGGRFLVHGGTVEVREGSWEGPLVIIGFPDMERARGWYDSPAYRAILPLRTRHIGGDVILVEGVAPGYEAAATARQLREAAAADVPAT
ncbi:DUF1330 domain-containing protein [Streptomyces olivoverticillatus]